MTNAATSNTTKLEPFFKLNGKYLIDPCTSESDMKIDIAVLLESSTATLYTIIDNMKDDCQSQVLFGVLYQLEMISSLVSALPEARS